MSSASSSTASSSVQGPIAFIGGSSFLESKLLSAFHAQTIATPHGACIIYSSSSSPSSSSLFFIQRHAARTDQPYSPPHLINKRSLMAALQILGVKKVIAFGSVGSLKKELKVGQLVIPDDFYDVDPVSMYEFEKRGHIGPSFNQELRAELIALLTPNFHPVPRGVYTQTRGPRFETPAEIRMLAMAGDLVGMTCAHEATLALECSLPYAVICMIDNMANGLGEEGITYEDFKAGVAKNLLVMDRVLETVIDHFKPQARAIDEVSSSSSAPPSSSSSSAAASAQISVASIVHAKYIVPMDDAETVLIDHAIIVDHAGYIVDIVPSASSSTSSSSSSLTSASYVSSSPEEHFPNSILLPGLINGHTHTGMTLMRGYADDFCLHDWLTQHIWPCEAQFVSPEFVSCSSRLALAESIRSGTTTINDMYWFPNVTAKLVDEIGTRALIGLPVLDFPGAWASDIDAYFAKGEQVRQSFDARHARLSFSVAPHAPYTVCDAHLTRCLHVSQAQAKLDADAAASSSSSAAVVTSNGQGEVHKKAKLMERPRASTARIHTHLHETRAECDHSESGNGPSKHRSEEKSRPIANLDRLGLLNEQLIAVHMTQLNADEIKLLLARAVNVVHCPTSNLKLASGFCPVSSLIDAGVHVGIGTDSTASNNSLDLWSEMKLTSLLAKGVTGEATVVPAYTALRMATIDGAKVLGLDKVTGSLVANKAADFIVVSLDALEMMPIFDVISHLVYLCQRANVTDVWCHGRRLLKQRQLLTLNEAELKRDIASWQTKLLKFKRDYLKTKHEQIPSKFVQPPLEAPASLIQQVAHETPANAHRHGPQHHEHQVHPPSSSSDNKLNN